MVGEVRPERGLALAEKYFGGIPARKTPAAPDYSEGLNTAGKRAQQSDALAQVPAIDAAWKMPERGSANQAPMAGLDALLAERGRASGRERVRPYEWITVGAE